MKENPNPFDASPAPAGDETDLQFASLQAAWDAHCRRLDGILAAADARAAAARRRSRVAAALMGLVLLGAAAAWAALFSPLAFSPLALAVCLAVEAAYLLLAFLCLRQIRPRRPSRPRRVPAPPLPRALRPNPIPRVAAVAAALALLLVVVSCAATGGDGLSITQNHPGRADAVLAVTQVLNQL